MNLTTNQVLKLVYNISVVKFFSGVPSPPRPPQQCLVDQTFFPSSLPVNIPGYATAHQQIFMRRILTIRDATDFLRIALLSNSVHFKRQQRAGHRRLSLQAAVRKNSARCRHRCELNDLDLPAKSFPMLTAQTNPTKQRPRDEGNRSRRQARSHTPNTSMPA